MRHHNSNRKLGLKRKGRSALLKSLARNLIREEKIVTTEAKAKELRSYVEKLISRSRKDSLANRRLVAAKITKSKEVNKLFKIGSRYQDRAGGYTRIVKLPRRLSDGSRMAQIELV
ncbi:MAG TPA: 50S ribosomal protein L17 [Candidatus Paceibacterota bacterium]|nr:50S ribosomal protein L17 [Candidatus Paceibacterota bacterium]